MTTSTQLLLLLQVVTQLLTVVQQRPQLSPVFRQTVISQAQKVIELAQKSILEEQQKAAHANATLIPTPSVASNMATSSYRIKPRPDYDLSQLAALIHDKINYERIQKGFGQLVYNLQLSYIAKTHSEDQTNDNLWSTDSDKPCSYIFIRHQGSGDANFSLGNRLKSASISFREARENIAGIGMSEYLTYRRNADEGAIQCPVFTPALMPDHTTPEEAHDIIHSNIALSKEVFQPISPVVWVNREWLAIHEIASQAVKEWLNSPGHKENLLTPDVTETGIGVAFINEYAIITQIFIKR